MLSTKAAAKIANVNASRIRQLCIAGRIKATRMARDWDVDEQSLRVYMQSRKQAKATGLSSTK